MERQTDERVELYAERDAYGAEFQANGTPFDIDNNPPSEDELRTAVSQLSHGRCGGASGIRAEHIKEMGVLKEIKEAVAAATAAVAAAAAAAAARSKAMQAAAVAEAVAAAAAARSKAMQAAAVAEAVAEAVAAAVRRKAMQAAAVAVVVAAAVAKKKERLEEAAAARNCVCKVVGCCRWAYSNGVCRGHGPRCSNVGCDNDVSAYNDVCKDHGPRCSHVGCNRNDHDDKQYGNGRQETHWQPTVVVVINQQPREHTFASQLSYSPQKPTWPTLPSMTRTHSAQPFRVKKARRIYSPQKPT
jgi:hypothetical protein